MSEQVLLASPWTCASRCLMSSEEARARDLLLGLPVSSCCWCCWNRRTRWHTPPVSATSGPRSSSRVRTAQSPVDSTAAPTEATAPAWGGFGFGVPKMALVAFVTSVSGSLRCVAAQHSSNPPWMSRKRPRGGLDSGILPVASWRSLESFLAVADHCRWDRLMEVSSSFTAVFSTSSCWRGSDGVRAPPHSLQDAVPFDPFAEMQRVLGLRPRAVRSVVGVRGFPRGGFGRRRGCLFLRLLRGGAAGSPVGGVAPRRPGALVRCLVGLGDTWRGSCGESWVMASSLSSSEHWMCLRHRLALERGATTMLSSSELRR